MQMRASSGLNLESSRLNTLTWRRVLAEPLTAAKICLASSALCRSCLKFRTNFSPTLAAPGQDPSRAALEALGLEAYRQRRISGYQLCKFLNIGSRYEFDGFLKQHQVEKYTVADFERDLSTIETEGFPAAPHSA